MMPGEIERVIVHPSSFYGSYKSSDGYCTRRTVGQQQNGWRSEFSTGSRKLLYDRMNGGKLRHSQLASNTTKAAAHQTSSVLAPRHCRYFNMQVRRLPRGLSACNMVHGVNGTRYPTTRRPTASAVTSTVAERTLASRRESRVFISAELKNKADSKMKNSLMSVHKSADSEADCSDWSSGGRKNVQQTDAVKKTDGTALGKGLKLRNGRSLPDCWEVKPEKSLTCTAGQQCHGNRFDVKAKKRRLQHRSRSLSPATPLALARPRRSVFTKKSVSCLFIINTPAYALYLACRLLCYLCYVF